MRDATVTGRNPSCIRPQLASRELHNLIKGGTVLPPIF